MNWLEHIWKAIDYVEMHLRDNISAQDVAEQLHVSINALQNNFSVLTGYSLGEYIRNRRLFLAALDLRYTNDKIIDIAYRYFYRTPESFSKAFSKFHHASPSQVREGSAIKKYLPLTLQLSIQGGEHENLQILSGGSLRIIGYQQSIPVDNAEKEITTMWENHIQKYHSLFFSDMMPSNLTEKSIVENHIGHYGIRLYEEGCKEMTYVIGGRYSGGVIPRNMHLYEVSAGEAIITYCSGSFQEVIRASENSAIHDWLRDNPLYEKRGNTIIERFEWFVHADNYSSVLRSIIIPIQKKIRSISEDK